MKWPHVRTGGPTPSTARWPAQAIPASATTSSPTQSRDRPAGNAPPDSPDVRGHRTAGLAPAAAPPLRDGHGLAPPPRAIRRSPPSRNITSPEAVTLLRRAQHGDQATQEASMRVSRIVITVAASLALVAGGTGALAGGAVAMAAPALGQPPGWSVVPSPNVAGSPNNELDGVSCVSVTACTAVGFYQDSSGAYSTLDRVVERHQLVGGAQPQRFPGKRASRRVVRVGDRLHRGRFSQRRGWDAGRVVEWHQLVGGAQPQPREFPARGA